MKLDACFVSEQRDRAAFHTFQGFDVALNSLDTGLTSHTCNYQVHGFNIFRVILFLIFFIDFFTW